MRRFFHFCALVSFLSAGGSLLMEQAAAATDETIRAFSVWQTKGELTPGGEGDRVFNDIFTGLFYVDTQKGPVAAGDVSCKANVQIKPDKTQKGSADCTITAKDGAQVFGRLSCSGVFLVGCSGKLVLTGGSGRFKGVTGGGTAIIRSEFADLWPQGNPPATDVKSGIIYFPALRYQLP